MSNMQFGVWLALTSFVIFVISTSLFGWNIEPSNGSTEVPENLSPDITDIRLLISIICIIIMIVGLIFIFIGVKEVKNLEDM